ncbi:MAG TPA: hypothetical protein VJN96_13950 [Vicinamibacterales bacterium]|nr:hypothetical protein [Vicinamibacterales bacterium]
MTKHRSLVVASLAFALALGFVAAPAPLRAAADTLPQRLSDQEFWKMIEDLSEPDGFFRSDNLLSNEIWFQTVIPDLLQRTKGGGNAYMGVGPEQNFTYISALKPKIVFITDIRRGNLHEQLMYKALFELSADRAEFVSRLFSKKRPEGLTTKSTGAELMNAFWDVQTSPEAAYRQNVKDIQDLLTKKHALPISQADLQAIADNVYYNFYWFGPSINYNSSSTGAGRGGTMVNYADLMMQTDGAGLNRSFLGSEENFQVLKDLEERNLIVPVVGNFGGPKALRAVGAYLKAHQATVVAFYLSNVEQYLNQDGIWPQFCSNVASLPLDDHSTFIRSAGGGGRGGYGGGGLMSYLGSMREETRGCGSGRPPVSGVRMPR